MIPNAATGWEMMEHTGLTSGLEAVGEVFRSTANIVCGQAEIACTPSRNRLYAIKAILLAILGR